MLRALANDFFFVKKKKNTHGSTTKTQTTTPGEIHLLRRRRHRVPSSHDPARHCRVGRTVKRLRKSAIDASYYA